MSNSNIKSDPKSVKLEDIGSSLLNPATEEKQDIVIDYLSGKAIRTDEVGNILYLGKAATGSLESDPVWQIQKVDKTTCVDITWADGDNLYDNIWDNRESLIYN